MIEPIIVIGVAVRPPRHCSPEMARLFSRLRRAGRAIDEIPLSGLDVTHLADLTEAAETILSIYRRARACRADGDGAAVGS